MYNVAAPLYRRFEYLLPIFNVSFIFQHRDTEEHWATEEWLDTVCLPVEDARTLPTLKNMEIFRGTEFQGYQNVNIVKCKKRNILGDFYMASKNWDQFSKNGKFTYIFIIHAYKSRLEVVPTQVNNWLCMKSCDVDFAKVPLDTWQQYIGY